MLARLAVAKQEVRAVASLYGLCVALACKPVEVDAFEDPALDACPDDPNKTQRGGCGCGVPDDDFDGDGALDCQESCPDNAGRAEPVGPCGCSNSTELDTCDELRLALRNLYTFDDTGLEILDSGGGRSPGFLEAATDATPLNELERQQRNGRVNLDGVGSFVDLGPGLLSGLTSGTFEVWLTWRGGAYWPRIFDFGDSDQDSQVGQSYVFLTPSNGATGTLRAAYSVDGDQAETRADAEVPLPPGRVTVDVPQHVALVIDATAGAMRLYLNGAEAQSVDLIGDLAQINDTNNWIGRSNYAVDPWLFGTLIEFRVYSGALSAAQINSSFLAGPGALD